ncbi:hypothetical protein RRG08_045833 [Elysia crispata]|uniref:Uncharacterized protein n=1 Tax=Elysia crispata TaxID=231223 RepID=A0AAE1B330_9GAST|nr:hypothetical protein RRG08_045833 [Elysia crispata]
MSRKFNTAAQSRSGCDVSGTEQDKMSRKFNTAAQSRSGCDSGTKRDGGLTQRHRADQGVMYLSSWPAWSLGGDRLVLYVPECCSTKALTVTDSHGPGIPVPGLRGHSVAIIVLCDTITSAHRSHTHIGMSDRAMKTLQQTYLAAPALSVTWFGQ